MISLASLLVKFESGLTNILATTCSVVFLEKTSFDMGQIPVCTAMMTRSIEWHLVHFTVINSYASRIWGGNPDASTPTPLAWPTILSWACATALTRSAKTRMINFFPIVLLPATVQGITRNACHRQFTCNLKLYSHEWA